MPPVRREVGPLTVLLGGLFAALVLAQVVILPRTVDHLAEVEPALTYLRAPVLAVSVFWLLCVQVVVVCTWRLLTTVADHGAVGDGTSGWVDAIVGAVVAAWVVLVGVLLHVLVGPAPPGLPVLLLVPVGAVLGLLVAAALTLLRQAAMLRAERDAALGCRSRAPLGRPGHPEFECWEFAELTPAQVGVPAMAPGPRG